MEVLCGTVKFSLLGEFAATTIFLLPSMFKHELLMSKTCVRPIDMTKRWHEQKKRLKRVAKRANFTVTVMRGTGIKRKKEKSSKKQERIIAASQCAPSTKGGSTGKY